MKKNTLLLLIAVAVFLTISVLLLNQPEESGDAERQKLFPKLTGVANEVVALEVAGGGDIEGVSLFRKEDRWLVANQNYPADFEQIKKQLVALSQATLVEAKTSNPENYHFLGIEKNAEPGKIQEKLLRLTSTDGSVFELIVGKVATGQKGRYVRRLAEDQVWLIDQPLELPVKAKDWLDKKLMNLPSGEVQSITFESKGSDGYRITREGRGDGLVWLDKPKGESVRHKDSINDLAKLFENLTLEDVKTASAADEDSNRVSYQLFSGIKIVVTSSPDRDRFIQLSLNLEKEITEKYLPKDVELHSYIGDAEKLLQIYRLLLEGRQFEVSQYRLNLMSKTVDDLLAQDEPPAGSE